MGIGGRNMYKIVRIYQYRNGHRTMKKGLTYEEAIEHCSDPETSSSTCKGYANRKRTERIGAWFDAFTEQ